ncbi:hypothetical protein SAMN05421690_10412 [Nitrosomonas sp. Nm51]|nr:hypothetical protein SAMN05421690_10412 [Nitrosomonas sp. Nm51]
MGNALLRFEINKEKTRHIKKSVKKGKKKETDNLTDMPGEPPERLFLFQSFRYSLCLRYLVWYSLLEKHHSL